jgi:hypothetical protein
MGIDWSAHPLDPALVTQRLIPCVLENKPINDLIERAVAIAAVTHRTQAWKLAASRVDGDLFWRVTEAAPKKRVPVGRPKRGLLSRWFGASEKDGEPEMTEVFEGPLCGLPGFESDLHVFGRPFFIDADDGEEAAIAFDRYMAAAEGRDGAVDAVVRDMLQALDAKRASRLPAGLAQNLADLVQSAPSLTSLAPQTETEAFDGDALRAQIERRVAAWRAAAAATDPKQEIGDGEERTTALAAQAQMPFDMVSFAAGLIPGWMGCGYGFASGVLAQIKAGGGLFESPASLFAPLIAAIPAAGRALAATITDNFTLGGWVPPDRVHRLLDVLSAKRDEIIVAFENNPSALTPRQREMLACDWIKFNEAATYAMRHGLGYIEAAEIYSGYFGWAN